VLIVALAGGVQGFDGSHEGVAVESHAIREDVEVWSYDRVQLRDILCACCTEDCAHCVDDRGCNIELGMVEGVKGLEAEFERASFLESSDLVQSDIVVVDPWTVEETPRGSSEGSQRVRAEEFGVESERIVARIVVDIQRAQTGIVVKSMLTFGGCCS